MTITDKLIPLGKYNRPGIKSTPKRICVHYTGDVGTNADRLALFFTANSAAKTSSHYIVGINGEVIRCIPNNEIAYAAANQNADTIHIEVCYKQASGQFESKTIEALGQLVRSLMKKYNIPAAKVLRHYDITGKHCPAYYVDENRWAALHEKITAEPKPGVLYRVQVGAFGSRENAENYAAKIKQAGFNAFVVQAEK